MAAKWLSFFALASMASGQITVTPQRIAGIPPDQWPIGDGGPAVDAYFTPGALAWDRSGAILERYGNALVVDSQHRTIRRLNPDGTISTVLNYAAYGIRFV